MVDPRDRALIFDMDGVLFLSSRAHHRAYEEALSPFGLRVPEYRMISGMRTDDGIRFIARWQGREILPGELAEMVQRKKGIARKILLTEPPIVPSASRVLGDLSSRGWSLGLASSASQESVNFFLRASGLSSLFGGVLSGDDVICAKPDPEIFLTCAKKLGVAPRWCWVIEDSRNGIVAANAAGMMSVGLAGELSWTELTECGAHSVIEKLENLVDGDEWL